MQSPRAADERWLSSRCPRPMVALIWPRFDPPPHVDRRCRPVPVPPATRRDAQRRRTRHPRRGHVPARPRGPSTMRWPAPSMRQWRCSASRRAHTPSLRRAIRRRWQRTTRPRAQPQTRSGGGSCDAAGRQRAPPRRHIARTSTSARCLRWWALRAVAGRHMHQKHEPP